MKKKTKGNFSSLQVQNKKNLFLSARDSAGKGGSVGILGFTDLANFCFGFPVFALFGFSVLCGSGGFSPPPIQSLVFGFCQQ